MPLFRFYTRLTKKYSSLFTFRSESPVFIGIPRGEEYSGTLHLLFTTLHLSSPLCFGGFAFLLMPRSLVRRWRVVKSGWRVANNSSPLETPCLWAFQGIRWRVKSFWRNKTKPRLPSSSRGFSLHYVSRIWLFLPFFCTILLNCMILFGSYNILL